MKKASLLASAAIASVALSSVPAFAQGGPFADVPTDHWAYRSVDTLQKQGIVIGYPDGTFGGKRAMTRYEFAVAIARLLEKVGTGPDLSNYYTKEQVDAALAGKADKSDLAGLATKEEVAQVRRLVTEFQNELTSLGVEIDAVKKRLDALDGRVTAIENELKRVKITGAVNFMSRANHRTGNNVGGIRDADGFTVTGGPGSKGSLLSDSRVLHDIDLGIKARLSDTATADVVLNFGNYLPFLNSVASYSGARSDRGPGAQVNTTQDQTVYKAVVEAPIKLPGLGSVGLSVGRMPVQFTPYTLKLIDVDSYFANDKTDLGDIPLDGAKGVFKLGPVGVTTFAAKASPIKYVSGAGTATTAGLYAGAGFSPFAGGLARFRQINSSVSPTANGALTAENIAGARATIGTSFLGTIGATYVAIGGNQTAAGVGGFRDFDRVDVYGADINTSISGIGLMGSYTQSDTRLSRGQTDGDSTKVRSKENYAWDAGAKYVTGSLSLGGGYKYISPYFAAPGYWGKIGSFTNPVDVKGGYVTAAYALGGGLTLAGEGHFLEGTGKAGAGNGLSEDDKINSFKAGVKYGLTSSSNVDLGVEYTDLNPAGPGGKAREIFYNFGYGFSFNPSTSFKFLYQVVDYTDRGANLDQSNRRGGVAAAQFSVKF